MRACAGAENAHKKRLRALFQTLCTAWVLCLCACTGSFETEPLVEFSTEVVVGGAQPHSIARQLDAGTWLLEVRERDIDLRVKVEAGAARTELADLVSEAAGGLSDRDRSVLDLAFRHGLEGTELAEALGVSVGNANTMVHRLRRTIERSLGALLVSRRARSAHCAARRTRRRGRGV